ncbi:uncharacterized protein [Fopius arisanus]|nr:PREDICTED: uncharacterized protein LOC105262990 isoform X2 [Fopius arisanus]
MGLKWFRARIALDKPTTHNSPGVPGFYRSVSNFDGAIWPPPPTLVQKPRPVAVPVAPPQVPVQSQNPTALQSSEYRRSSASSEEGVGGFKLPRASVEILREKQIEDTTKKAVRKKKAAPKPGDAPRKNGSSGAREFVI